MAHRELDEMDESFKPLAQAIGRAVLGAAVLEKVLLVDIARRRVEDEGLATGLGAELARLEGRPAGVLLARLRELGISDQLAGEIGAVIGQRNSLVHRYLEEPGVAEALLTGDGLDELVDRVDQLAADCQRLVNALAPLAFAGAERAFGVDVAEIARQVARGDLEEVKDERLRAQLRVARLLGQRLDADPPEPTQ